MSNTEAVWRIVDNHRQAFEALSDQVWATPELAYNEFRSAAAHRQQLEQFGFRITDGVAGIPTAIMGEAGQGGPVIAILGEYDALPGLGQEAGIAEPKSPEGDGSGHGCGHNLLGAASMLAATAVKDHLERTGTEGRVRYYGCPAEEGGAAKTFMVRAGAFSDVDIAICWHPDAFSRVDEAESLANTRIDFTFQGRAAHAAIAPHLGRSALDAVELTSVGVNYMREHVPSDARIHYALLDAGGVAPNVVQAHAKVRYAVRARDLEGMSPLVERVKRVAEGAAMMTETSVDWRIVSAVSNLLGNAPLEEAMQANFDRLGGVPFDDADRSFASRIQATLTRSDIESAYRRVGEPFQDVKPLCDFVVPWDRRGDFMPGSTDLDDVSWTVPTVQARVATHAIGTPGHSWQVTAQGKTPAAHKGMVHAAKIMAGTALDTIHNGDLIERAKADLAERTGRKPYVCPIPDDVQPPIVQPPAA